MKKNGLRVNTLFVSTLIFVPSLIHPDTIVNLHDLVLPPQVEEDSTSKLMQLPLGLHRIEPPSDSVNRILIAVHDANTHGFEWTLPLQSIDDESTDTFFIRWDSSECPNKMEEEVRKEISSILKSHESVPRLTLIGHGMGGVYLSQFTRNWRSLVRIDVHAIAAPLKGTVGVFSDQDCGETLPKRLPPTIRFFQWRMEPSQHSLFKELSEDPQVVDLDGSLVISLPPVIDDHAVDATRALEIVASRIQAEYLEEIERSKPVETEP